MKIDLDVAAVAAHWGLDPQLLQAVVRAEGDIIKAVRITVPSVTTRQQALEILARSATHRMWEYVKAHSAPGYVEYFASKWAPLGVANDPTNLNANWARNVLALWVPK